MSDYSKNESKIILFLTIMIAFTALSTLFFLRLYNLKNGYEYGVDVFYHIKMGDFFPKVCMDKTFSWTQLSIWKTNFYDKELGFHILLSVIISIINFLNIKCEPPFDFINLALTIILTLPIIFYCLKNKLITSFLAVPSIFFISPLFLLRINMIRPHVISIALFILVIYLLSSEMNFRKKCIFFFLLSWIYTFTYSVPQVLFIPLFAFCIADFIGNKQFKLRIYLIIFAAGTAGIIAGILIHPQFPNSLYCWYIQGIMVIEKILGLSNGYVDLGLELIAPSKETLLQNISIFIFVIINSLLIILTSQKTKNNSNIYMLFIVQFLMTSGFIFSERCIEYAVPAAVLCFIFLIDKIFKIYKIRFFYRIASPLLFMLIIFVSLLHLNISYLKSSQFAPCMQFAEWTKKHIKPGTYIGQIRWGEFPRLFYPAPQFRYSMAMDPMFSYFQYPEQTEKLEKFRMLLEPLSPEELSEMLKTEIVFISIFDPVPAKHLIHCGAKILYFGNDGWLLLLKK